MDTHYLFSSLWLQFSWSLWCGYIQENNLGNNLIIKIDEFIIIEEIIITTNNCFSSSFSVFYSQQFFTEKLW